MGYPFQLNDRVITKKAHPCGGDAWLVVRTGADIKLKCETCGHIVMLDRCKAEKRVKKYIEQKKDAHEEQRDG